jgi:hypothetical protein
MSSEQLLLVICGVGVSSNGTRPNCTLVKGHKGGRHNAAHFMMANAAGLHDHLVPNGDQIVKGLRGADYGLRGFVFAGPTATASTSGSNCPPPGSIASGEAG